MNKEQNTILAIDVGNSSIHWNYIKDGVVDGYKRNKHTELSMLPWDEVKAKNYPVVIGGALVHINESVESIAKDYGISFIELDVAKQNIIKNVYPTLGVDRVCNLIAATEHFKNSPVIVFDFGTATTMTACDENKNFLGGLITTGCEIELKAISSKTLSLPHVDLAKEEKIKKLTAIAQGTEDAILNGVIVAQMGLIDYYLWLFKEETKLTPKVVFTGGNASTIAKFCKKADLCDPHLTLKGIYHCYKSVTLAKCG